MMYLGIEIGGTKLQLGLGRGDGRMTAIMRCPVRPADGGEGIRRQIAGLVPELLRQNGLDNNDLNAVGVGFGGPVDDRTHTVIKSHQIEGWDDFPLADWLADLLGIPVALGNDCDCASLAEALFGAGKDLSPIYYITIGSGIGGGLVIDGKIYRGAGRGAAEIGHLRIPVHAPENADDPQVVFGHVTLESLASGWSIQESVKAHLAPDGPTTQLILQLANYDPRQITAELIAQAAQQGDPLAKVVLARAVNRLADGICHVIALLCPRRIVIGGGVSLMGEELLFEPLRRLVRERVFAPFADCYDIVPAALSEEVVVHGALALARLKLPL